MLDQGDRTRASVRSGLQNVNLHPVKHGSGGGSHGGSGRRVAAAESSSRIRQSDTLQPHLRLGGAQQQATKA